MRGVSLLEMLVALTILAGAAVVVFDWLAQSGARMQALQLAQRHTMAQLKTVAFLETINPAVIMRGKQVFDEFDVTWQATALTPFKRMRDPADEITRHEIAVFALDVTLQWAGGETVQFDTRLAGWREIMPSVAGGGLGVALGQDSALTGAAASAFDTMNPPPKQTGMSRP